MNRVIQLTFSSNSSFISEESVIIGLFAEDKLEEAKQAALDYIKREINEPEYWSSEEGDVAPSKETIDKRTREYVVALDWRPLNQIKPTIDKDDEITMIGITNWTF